MAKIFGGSASKSQQSSQQTAKNESGNLAYPFINQSFGVPGAGAYGAGVDALQNELAGGYEGYKKNTNFDFWEKLGLRQIGAGGAGRGMFNSGATMKGLMDYEQNIGSASYNDYLSQQGALAGLGYQGGALTTQAGQWSKGESQGTSQGTSKSKEYEGLGNFIGQILAAGKGG